MALTRGARRTAFIVLVTVAALCLLGALIVTFAAAESAGVWLAVFAGVLVIVLAAEVVLLAIGGSDGRSRRRSRYDEDDDWEGEEEDDGVDGEELLLRCANCREVFPVIDDGRRPLRHSCPHCGKTGILKDAPPKPQAHYGPGYGGRR